MGENQDRGQAQQVCFVIAPIGDPGSNVRRRSDQVLKHIIKPVVEKLGYQAKRADEISEPGIITNQIIQHVISDDLVVADLSGRNPNVFYELAIRHMLRKPVVLITQAGEPLPFDVAQNRTIYVDHQDLDSVEDCRRELARQAEAALRGELAESPISIGMDVMALQSSGDAEKVVSAEMMSEIAEVRRQMSALTRLVSGMADALRSFQLSASPLSFTPSYLPGTVAQGLPGNPLSPDTLAAQYAHAPPSGSIPGSSRSDAPLRGLTEASNPRKPASPGEPKKRTTGPE